MFSNNDGLSNKPNNKLQKNNYPFSPKQIKTLNDYKKKKGYGTIPKLPVPNNSSDFQSLIELIQSDNYNNLKEAYLFKGLNKNYVKNYDEKLLDEKAFNQNLKDLNKIINFHENYYHKLKEFYFQNNEENLLKNENGNFELDVIFNSIKSSLKSYIQYFNDYQNFCKEFLSTDYLLNLDKLTKTNQATLAKLASKEKEISDKIANIRYKLYKIYYINNLSQDFNFNTRLKYQINNYKFKSNHIVNQANSLIQNCNYDNLDDKEKILLLTKIAKLKSQLEANSQAYNYLYDNLVKSIKSYQSDYYYTKSSNNSNLISVFNNLNNNLNINNKILTDIKNILDNYNKSKILDI